jgi:single-stranded DNA-binding protein
MARASNLWTGSGRLVADPVVHKGTVASMRLAVDYSGNDQTNPDNKTGFFDVKVFLGDKTFEQTFMTKQINEGKFKKGSAVSLVGALKQETYEDKEGQKRSTVVVHAESMQYFGYATSNQETTTEDPAVATIEVPNEF